MKKLGELSSDIGEEIEKIGINEVTSGFDCFTQGIEELQNALKNKYE